MAKKAAKRTAKSGTTQKSVTAQKSGTTKLAKTLPSLLGKPGTTVKIVSLNQDCGHSESAGSFTLEGTFSKPRPRTKKTK